MLLFHSATSGLYCCFKVQHVEFVAVSRCSTWDLLLWDLLLFQGAACGTGSCFQVLHVEFVAVATCGICCHFMVHHVDCVALSGNGGDRGPGGGPSVAGSQHGLH